MYTLNSFQRRLYAADHAQGEVELPAGRTGWLPARQHSGHNIGSTDTHVIFVELKEGATGLSPDLGPVTDTE